jgi:hypothetical protein
MLLIYKEIQLGSGAKSYMRKSFLIYDEMRKFIPIYSTSGFWPRVRARALRAPVFLGSLPRQTGRCAPPPHSSFAAYKKIVQKQNGSLLARTRAARGVYLYTGPPRIRNKIFAAPRPTYRALLSNAAPY